MAEPTADNAKVRKSQRIDLRATERQEAVLKQAAVATDRSVSDFILDSAVQHAERILADRRWFVATDADFDEFQRLLDEPLPSTLRLQKLWARETPFGRPLDSEIEK
jgi:uncharacterized protein (DUF1778 family)